jgi:hypothetical protein
MRTIEELRCLVLRLRVYLLRRPLMFTVRRYGDDPLNDGCTFWVVARTLGEALRLAREFDSGSVRTTERRASHSYVEPAPPHCFGVQTFKRWGPAEWGAWWDEHPAQSMHTVNGGPN